MQRDLNQWTAAVGDIPEFGTHAFVIFALSSGALPPKKIKMYKNQAVVSLTASTNLFTVSEFPDLRKAT